MAEDYSSGYLEYVETSATIKKQWQKQEL